MKRILALLLAALLLSLCACGARQPQVLPAETTTDPTADGKVHVVLKDTVLQKDFTAEDGTVAVRVDITLPAVLEDFSGQLHPSLLSEVTDQFAALQTETLTFAEHNVENAYASMQTTGQTEPWLCKLDYEVPYQEDSFLGVVVRSRFAMSGNPEVAPRYITRMIDLYTTHILLLTDFAVKEEATFRAAMVQTLVNRLRSDYQPTGEVLQEDQLTLLAESFDPAAYWMEEDGSVTLVLDEHAVGRSGTYLCKLSAAEVDGILFSPADYRALTEAAQ